MLVALRRPQFRTGITHNSGRVSRASFEVLQRLCTCRTGPSEIIENEHTGLLTPVGDSHALANAICQLLASSETREVMSQRAAERAQRLFDVAHILEDWEQLFLSSTLNRV